MSSVLSWITKSIFWAFFQNLLSLRGALYIPSILCILGIFWVLCILRILCILCISCSPCLVRSLYLKYYLCLLHSLYLMHSLCLVLSLYLVHSLCLVQALLLYFPPLRRAGYQHGILREREKSIKLATLVAEVESSISLSDEICIIKTNATSLYSPNETSTTISTPS